MEILRAKQSWKSSDVGASVELEVLQGFEKLASGNQAGAILSADVNISPEKWSVGNCFVLAPGGGRHSSWS